MWDIASIVMMWIGVAAIAALVWVLIEVALTMKKARKTIGELKERVEPTLAHVEQITSSLEPAVERLDPLMERVSLTVDTVNLELMQVDKILSDASDVTGKANSAVQKISDVASTPSNLINDAAKKLREALGKKREEKRVELAMSQQEEQAEEPDIEDEKATQDLEEGENLQSSEIAHEWARSVSEKEEDL